MSWKVNLFSNKIETNDYKTGQTFHPYNSFLKNWGGGGGGQKIAFDRHNAASHVWQIIKHSNIAQSLLLILIVNYVTSADVGL